MKVIHNGLSSNTVTVAKEDYKVNNLSLPITVVEKSNSVMVDPDTERNSDRKSIIMKPANQELYVEDAENSKIR